MFGLTSVWMFFVCGLALPLGGVNLQPGLRFWKSGRFVFILRFRKSLWFWVMVGFDLHA